jgi:hypothetical protein
MAADGGGKGRKGRRETAAAKDANTLDARVPLRGRVRRGVCRTTADARAHGC